MPHIYAKPLKCSMEIMEFDFLLRNTRYMNAWESTFIRSLINKCDNDIQVTEKEVDIFCDIEDKVERYVFNQNAYVFI